MAAKKYFSHQDYCEEDPFDHQKHQSKEKDPGIGEDTCCLVQIKSLPHSLVSSLTNLNHVNGTVDQSLGWMIWTQHWNVMKRCLDCRRQCSCHLVWELAQWE